MYYCCLCCELLKVLKHCMSCATTHKAYLEALSSVHYVKLKPLLLQI